MNWMILPFKRYAEFSGRSRRMEYWMFALLNVIVITALMFLVLGTGGAAAFIQEQATGNPLAGLDVLLSGESEMLVVGAYGLALRTEDGGLNWKESNFTASNGEPLMSAARLPHGTMPPGRNGLHAARSRWVRRCVRSHPACCRPCR